MVHLGADIPHEIQRMSTGSIGLDLALNGGWGVNHWHEIVGEYSSGKTMLVLKTIAYNQAIDPEWTAVWIDAEGFVPEYAIMCGCDLDRMLIVDTNIAEEAYDAALEATDSRNTDCVVIDSLPALVPSGESEGDMDTVLPGLMARKTNQFFRKNGKTIKRSLVVEERPILGIIINQYRMKIGIQFGDPRTTPGGQGKDYGFHSRTEVRRADWITQDKERVGQTVACRIIKNKLGPAQRKAEFDFYFDGHRAGEIDRMAELLYIGTEYDLIARSGSGYILPITGERVSGKAKLFEAMGESPEIQQHIFDAAMELFNGR